ncbi:MAG: radical SAM protein, partial [Synergistaceae bacterium]|nr:radical SAM protein [Synergistaceae bacterium]
MNGKFRHPTSLYIHVPFCERKCGYCSFYSVTGKQCVSSYLEALSCEATRYSRHDRVPLSTLYIGGGTPTVLALNEWEELTAIIHQNFDTSSIIEATCEANPNSFTPELVEFLKANNFTRISLGVQSMNDNELETLGRIHDSESARNAMKLVKSSGLN